MASRPQSDIDAEAFHDRQLEEFAARSRANSDFSFAVRIARTARTEAGLNCSFTANGEARFTIQQGLKAACHGREDAAATLILQVKLLERLDRLYTLSKIGIALLILLAIRSFV